jgi:hypothetical protein
VRAQHARLTAIQRRHQHNHGASQHCRDELRTEEQYLLSDHAAASSNAWQVNDKMQQRTKSLGWAGDFRASYIAPEADADRTLLGSRLRIVLRFVRERAAGAQGLDR